LPKFITSEEQRAMIIFSVINFTEWCASSLRLMPHKIGSPLAKAEIDLLIAACYKKY
jgi:hypothetical protein